MPYVEVELLKMSPVIEMIDFVILENGYVVYAHGFRREERISTWLDEGRRLDMWFTALPYPRFAKRMPFRRARWIETVVKEREGFAVRLGLSRISVRNAERVRLFS